MQEARTKFRLVRVAFILAIGYAAGSFLAYALFRASTAGAVFFPPAGMTVAALAMNDRRRWPALLAVIASTEILVDLSQGQQIRHVWGFALANTVEPLVGALILTRRYKGAEKGVSNQAFPLGRYLGGAVIVGPLVGAAFGTATIVWGQHKGSWGSVFLPFWAGDALGVLVIGGTLLLGRSSLPGRRLPSPGIVVGTALAVGATTVVAYLPSSTPLFYLPLPLLAFVAIRSRNVTLVGLACIVMAVVANFMSAFEFGPWAQVASRPHYGISTLQGFLAITTVMGLFLAHEADQRFRAERSAIHAEVRRATLQTIFDHAPCGVVETSLDGTIRHTNDTFVRMVGWSSQALVGSRRFSELLTVGGRLYYESHFSPLLRVQGVAQSIAFDVATERGGRLPVLINAELVVDSDGNPGAVLMAVFDARERRSYEQELITERERAQRSARELGALQHLTARLSTASTTDEIAAAVISDGTSLLAAHAVLAVIDRRQPGVLRTWPTFGEHDPVVASLRFVPMEANLPVTAVVHSGSELELRTLAEIEQGYPLSGTTFANTDTKSLVGLPIFTANSCVGALVLGFPNEGAAQAGAVTNARAIATLIGTALERAWRYEYEYDSAHELQRAFLPVIDDLRDLGIAVSAHYRPAAEKNDVGGDWYDAFILPDGDVALVVGDVVGHDLTAAATMGRLQSVVRLLAMTTPDPAELLAELDRAVLAIPAAFGTTMFYARVSPETGWVKYSSAGHPPPLLVGETVEILNQSQGVPVGVLHTRRTSTVRFEAGSHLVLYTDGLIEKRRVPLDESIQEFVEVTKRLSIQSPDEWCDEVLRNRLGPDQFDDAILMCVTMLA